MAQLSGTDADADTDADLTAAPADKLMPLQSLIVPERYSEL